jgi:hypothetical protein
MTLTRLLGIKVELLPPESRGGVQLAERVWSEMGCPTGVQALSDLLESVIERSARNGIFYPPILLKRKKQLERGTWKPEPPSCDPQGSSNLAAGPNCPDCGGNGYIVRPGGGSGSLCMRCEAWKRGFGTPAEIQ